MCVRKGRQGPRQVQSCGSDVRRRGCREPSKKVKDVDSRGPRTTSVDPDVSRSLVWTRCRLETFLASPSYCRTRSGPVFRGRCRARSATNFTLKVYSRCGSAVGPPRSRRVKVSFLHRWKDVAVVEDPKGRRPPSVPRVPNVDLEVLRSSGSRSRSLFGLSEIESLGTPEPWAIRGRGVSDAGGTVHVHEAWDGSSMDLSHQPPGRGEDGGRGGGGVTGRDRT